MRGKVTEAARPTDRAAEATLEALPQGGHSLPHNSLKPAATPHLCLGLPERLAKCLT